MITSGTASLIIKAKPAQLGGTNVKFLSQLCSLDLDIFIKKKKISSF